MNYPTISIIIVTKNIALKLDKCLRAISRQKYPKEKIEVLVIDGGSTDNTREIVENYGADFIEGGYPDNMEARRYVGVKSAKNEVLAFVDSDNYMPTENWLGDMVMPLVKDDEIFAVETLRYTYRRDDTLLNRYSALFGATDPVASYLGKRDRLTYYETSWSLKGDAIDKGGYYKVRFSEDIPTIGCNGFLIRKNVLEEVLTVPEDFFHTDVILDVIRRGHVYMAFVKNDIIHDTNDSLRNLLHKRTSYFQNHGIDLVERRRYKVYDSSRRRDKLLLFLYTLFTITLVKPLFDSVRGFLKRSDAAWFVHPVICYIFLISYGYVVIKKTISNS